VVHQEGQSPARVDATTPNHARVYDYMLGGKDNFAADREAGDRLVAVIPDLPVLAHANRQFLVRVVRFLAEAGIRQFLDLGTGIPTSPSVHEVARSVDPSARVVYVDNDPIVVVHNHALLATDDGVITIEADIRRPKEVLSNPELQALIDFDEPVGLLLLAVTHLVAPAEDPGGIVATLRDQLAPGSYLALCQLAADSDPAGVAQFGEIYANSPVKITFRTRDEIQQLFDGFELLPPGLVDIPDWRPETKIRPTLMKVVGGVGRKN
jgi:hypothetical protein